MGKFEDLNPPRNILVKCLLYSASDFLFSLCGIFGANDRLLHKFLDHAEFLTRKKDTSKVHFGSYMSNLMLLPLQSKPFGIAYSILPLMVRCLSKKWLIP